MKKVISTVLTFCLFGCVKEDSWELVHKVVNNSSQHIKSTGYARDKIIFDKIVENGDVIIETTKIEGFEESYPKTVNIYNIDSLVLENIKSSAKIVFVFKASQDTVINYSIPNNLLNALSGEGYSSETIYESKINKNRIEKIIKAYKVENF